KYKLQEKMMQAVKNSLEDADIALLVVDISEDWKESDKIFSSLNLKVPAIVVLNKVDLASAEKIKKAISFFESKIYCKKLITLSALKGTNQAQLLNAIL